MNILRFLGFLSVVFCSAVASPAWLVHRLGQTKSVDVAPAVTTDDVRLCSDFIGGGYDYGDQSNQSRLASDCKQLANETKILADKQGNFSEPCNAAATEFAIFAGYGDCTMWFECPSPIDTIVNFGYGDVADVLGLATNALQSSGGSTNTSVTSASASMSCQSHQMNWLVAFNGSRWSPGMGPTGEGSMEHDK